MKQNYQHDFNYWSSLVSQFPLETNSPGEQNQKEFGNAINSFEVLRRARLCIEWKIHICTTDPKVNMESRMKPDCFQCHWNSGCLT